ncbi:MAG: tetratricopeptide repeat protein [Phycisphaerales bacterium]
MASPRASGASPTPGPGGRLEQARALIEAGRPEQAKALVQRLLQSTPGDAAANDLMRSMCVSEGRLEQALFFAERAHRAAPDHAGVMADYAALLGARGRGSEALPLLERALSIDPRNRQAHFALVAELFTAGRIAEAEAAARRALEAHPGDRDLELKLAAALLNLGLADRATPLLSAMLFRSPDDLGVAEALATIINYDPGADRQRVFQSHVNCGRLLATRELIQPFRHEASAKARGGRLRVGLLSPDLRQHSVGFFAEPIIEHLDRDRFDVYVYDTSPAPDDATARMRRHPCTWRRAGPSGPSATPAALAAGIHADALDVLIELSGLTAGHSLAALLFRPARVQATYLGFPNTTGVPAIDFRIVDSSTDPGPPAGDADMFASERLVRLDPCFLCYRPSAGAPVPRTRSARPPGAPVTFGCFNALTKINDPLLRLWARVLEATPGSRLLLKTRELASPDVREHLARRCAAAGLPRERVEIAEPTRGLDAHLAVYDRVDVALDTFPYAGTTTTCDALWMGVPVVSRAGDRHASRVGLSLLACVGHAEWCAERDDEYVRLAAALARGAAFDPASTGPALRAAVASSPLCDAPGFARRFEAAIEQMAGRAAAAS